MENKSLIDTYEQQFSNCTAEISNKIARIKAVNGFGCHDDIPGIDRLIDECKELLEQMELEIRNLSKESRQIYNTRLNSYKTELDSIEKQLKSIIFKCGNEIEMRNDLFDGGDVFVPDEQKQKLLNNMEDLELSTKKIRSGYQTVLETGEIGKNILEDLSSQKEILQRSRNRLYETDSQLGKSSRILSTMMRRIIQNKILLIVVAITIMLLIVSVIYLTARKH